MYTVFYKLSAKPFQLSPDPNFFFASSGHKRAMAYLNYGLSLAEGFIVITGEVGAGKTLLVRKLFNSFGTENIVSAHLVSTQLDAEDTLRTVAAGFGLEQEGRDKSSIIKSLENFLVHCQQQRKRVLLVVDEAQNLTSKAVEELRMLSNFQMGNQSLLQSFLIGQPELRNTLQSEEMLQLKQRVIASYHLGPIEAAETQNYIEHRLTLAGWQGDPEFTAEAYQLIFEFTGGIPRKINTLCDRLMVFGMLEERHRIDQDMVAEVIKDLEQEVTHAALPAQPLRSSKAPVTELTGTQEGIARLEAKMDSIEKSLTQLLTVLVRKLHPAVESNTEK